MDRRIHIISISLLVTFLFSGCASDNFFDIQNSMSPPSISESEKEIENEIESRIGNNFKFCYPLINGSYSTNIQCRFNDADYMVVFCQTEDSVLKSHTLFLEKINDHWRMKEDIVEGNFKVTDSRISDINNDGFDEIVLEGIDLNTLRPQIYAYQIQKNGIIQLNY